ncbi:MAG: type IV secretory system conjugative DNA transfer family protein [Acidimicrobiaceae bacterium]|nr:type IV secretory system conjugative DNA transfer family protein [Acidimicrobiaceae bacterium]
MGLWEFAKTAARVSAKASQITSRGVEQRIRSTIANGGAHAARKGLIGPWDPPPPPNVSGYLNFAGVARPEDIDCREWWFPLGRYVVPKYPWQATDPIGLSASEINRHTLVVGPTRAGKTAGLIAPWIVEGVLAGYNVVTLDLKGGGDLQRDVAAYRDSLPTRPPIRLRRWDYRNPSARNSWNFIRELDSDGAINAAAEAICGRPRDNDPNRNFHLRDLKWAKGLLELAYDTGEDLTVKDILSLLADQQSLESVIRAYPQSRGAQRIADLCTLDFPEYSKTTQFLTTYFEVLNNDGFVSATSQPRLSLNDVASGQASITIINAPVSDGELAEIASGLFMSLLLNRRLSAFGQTSAPLLVVLDESPRLQDRIDLGRTLSLAAGANVSLLLAAQEIEQFHEDKRNEILANCGTLVVMAGCNFSTTDVVMKRLGSRVETQLSSTSTYDKNGRSTGYTSNINTVPVLGHNELSNPPTGIRGATVVNNRLSRRPVLVDFTRPDLTKPD